MNYIKFKNHSKSLLLCLLVAILIPLNAIAQQGTLEGQQITSSALEGNLIGDSAKRYFYVYLPPSYEAGLKSYPSVYMLHGYSQNGSSYTDLKPTLDSMIKNGQMGEMIIVFVDGSNKFGGSWYQSSITIGDYEKYITRDIVNLVDAKYRTINHKDSRGVTGISMGGYGCMRLALKYPNVFSVVAANGGPYNNDSDYSRNLFKTTATANPKDWGAFYGLFWMSQASFAYVAGSSPNPDKPPFFLDKPFEIVNGVIQAVPDVRNKCIDQDILHGELNRYVKQPVRLNNILILHATNDSVVPVSEAQELDKAMTESGVKHVYKEHLAEHTFVATDSFKFLSDNLSFSLPVTTSIQSYSKLTTTWGMMKSY
jgi:dienelactone hydrolase